MKTAPEQLEMDEKINLDQYKDDDDKELGKCQNLSSYVLNHEFMDLSVHDKGSGNIKCMTTCQCCMRVFYYLVFAFAIFFAFYYPIMMETSAGEVKKIRTFTSPNAASKK